MEGISFRVLTGTSSREQEDSCGEDQEVGSQGSVHEVLWQRTPQAEIAAWK